MNEALAMLGQQFGDQEESIRVLTKLTLANWHDLEEPLDKCATADLVSMCDGLEGLTVGLMF